MLYFDHNATSPMTASARQVWLDAAERWIGNPSSQHRLGSRASAAMEEARHRLAVILGCHPLDLVFTSGGTESNNHALHHLARALTPDQEVWISSIEHPCLVEAARFYFPGRVRWLPATRLGQVDLGVLDDWASARLPGLVCLMAANNETGVLQPWSTARAWCAAREIPFLCDATQWLGKLPAQGLGGCDWVSGCAHKFGGPRGVGFLKCPTRGRVSPLMRGGSQEEGRRAGTENVPGILSLVSALESREAWLAAGGVAGAAAGKDRFENSLLRELPGVEIVGQGVPRLWNTVAALFPQQDCQQRWVVKLDRQGCAVSTGSACASGTEEPSHVLKAMGFGDGEANRMIRLSSGWDTTEGDWDRLLDAIKTVREGFEKGNTGG
jgi:cysteine desulfurase